MRRKIQIEMHRDRATNRTEIETDKKDNFTRASKHKYNTNVNQNARIVSSYLACFALLLSSFSFSVFGGLPLPLFLVDSVGVTPCFDLSLVALPTDLGVCNFLSDTGVSLIELFSLRGVLGEF